MGAKPYYITIPQRIAELSQALYKMNSDPATFDEEKSRIWALEITLLCQVMQKIRNESKKIEVDDGQ